MKPTYLFYTIYYRSLGRKWEFRWPGNQTLLVDCKGQEQALGVARIIAGSLKRSDNRLDNLARQNITAYLRRATTEQE